MFIFLYTKKCVQKYVKNLNNKLLLFIFFLPTIFTFKMYYLKY